MDAWKELLVTSILALALAVGLGTLSFSLFSGAPPNVQIDVFAEKNGVTSVSFLPQDQVLLEAQVSSNNASIAGDPVTFNVESPNGTNFLVQTANTDNQGKANVTFQIPWPSPHSPETSWAQGTWQIQATTRIYGETVNSTTNFDCAPNVQIDVFAEKNGVTSVSFLPQDQVLLEAQVSSNNASIAGDPVTFNVESPNGTNFLVQTTNTDNQGTANVTFQIPWPLIESPETTWELGTWQISATSQVYSQTFNATTNFDCQTITPRIDAYANKGGYGQNTAGGTFLTNETFEVYIEVWNELNQTVPGEPVSLEVLILGQGHYRSYVTTTNASGIATIPNPINPTAIVTYEDVATANIGGVILTDVVTIRILPSS